MRVFPLPLAACVLFASFASAAPDPATPPAPSAAPSAPAAVAPAAPVPATVPVLAKPAPRTRPVAAKKPAPPPEPARPAPSISLALSAPSPDAAWTIRVENTGAVPLQLIADARLLSFEVSVPGAKRPTRCALPLEMRAHGDGEDRALVLPPGRAYSEKFDPRLFCFTAREGAARMAAGATVVAHLGWTPQKKLAPPYVVRPIEGLEPAVAAAKEIVSAPVGIGAATTTPKEPDPSRPIAVQTPQAIDVGRALDIALPVTIANIGSSNVTFLLRPTTITLDVNGPSGIGVTDPSPSVRCESSTEPNTAIPDVFSTLAPRGKASLTVMVSVLCPEHTFDQGGLYTVRARLDTRHASGREFGVRSFDGDVPSDTATRVRIREDQAPLGPRARPKLDDAPRASVAPPSAP